MQFLWYVYENSNLICVVMITGCIELTGIGWEAESQDTSYSCTTHLSRPESLLCTRRNWIVISEASFFFFKLCKVKTVFQTEIAATC